MRLEQSGGFTGPIRETRRYRGGVLGGNVQTFREGPFSWRLVCDCGHECYRVERSTAQEWREKAARGYRIECPVCFAICDLTAPENSEQLGLNRVQREAIPGRRGILRPPRGRRGKRFRSLEGVRVAWEPTEDGRARVLYPGPERIVPRGWISDQKMS